MTAAHAGARSKSRANVFLTVLSAMMSGLSSYRALLAPGPWAIQFRSWAGPASLRRGAPLRVRSRSPAEATVLRVSPREYDASPPARIRQLECWVIFLLSHPHELVRRLLPLACPCSLMAELFCATCAALGRVGCPCVARSPRHITRRLHLFPGLRNAPFSVISGANGCIGRSRNLFRLNRFPFQTPVQGKIHPAKNPL